MKLIVSSYNKECESLSLFDYANNCLSKLDFKELYEPSFVISYKDYVFTYSKNPLKVVVYKVENTLLQVDEMLIPNLKTMTHLAYNEKYHLLYGASYGDGAYFVVNVNEDMKLSNLKVYFQNEDNETSHCHCVAISDDYEEVMIVNISLDKIFLYDKHMNYLDAILLPSKVGPRHALYFKDLIYVVTEYSNEVIVIDRKTKYIIQRISTLLDNNTKSNCATLFFSKDKLHLYATNRGEDSISVFKVGKSLKYEKTLSVYGNHPRHTILVNNIIINCNNNSNNLVFTNEDGKLLLDYPYNNISSIAFVE